MHFLGFIPTTALAKTTRGPLELVKPEPFPMETPSFFKVMIGDFTTTLRIPPVFKKHLGEAIRRKSVLRRGAAGRRWRIEMGVEDGQLFFRDGWESFVSDCSISCGDFLVFFYDGAVGFDVKIYGTSGCEKEERIPVSIKQEVKIEVKSEDSDEDKVAPNVTRKRKESPVEKKRISPKKSKMCYKVLTGAKGTKNEKAMKAACAFKSAHPHFVTTCRNSRTSYMTIPAELATKYNLDEKDSIVLRDPRDTAWSVKLSTWRDGRRCLSSGWSHLYRKNSLKEGDVCVLEFVQGGTAINVHIFRADEHSAKSTLDQSARSAFGASKRPKTSTCHDAQNLKHSVEVKRERHLSEADKRRVIALARSFESRHPRFISVWRASRLYHVPIPKKVALEVGLKRDRCTKLIDPAGKSWPVNITVRSYGQVELGVGWSHFSRGHKLTVGDICIYEFLGEGDSIKVHIFHSEETKTSTVTDVPAASDTDIPAATDTDIPAATDTPVLSA